MVKYVVDVRRGFAAVGGELHADAEALLLENGSRQADLWGANYYPGLGEEQCIEYTSLINISPARGNRGMEMTQHSTLDAARWTEFGIDQQILMIGNEMNRAKRFFGPGDLDRLRRGYERVLALVDRTVEAGPRPALLRELLRWRDLVAELFTQESPRLDDHLEAFRALLRLHPTASLQIPYVVPISAAAPRP